MREADGWDVLRKQLRQVVEARGPSQVAAEIPVGRTTLFRLLKGECTPSLPTEDCIERFLADQTIVEERRRN